MSKRLLTLCTLPAWCLALTTTVLAQDETAPKPASAMENIGYFLGYSVGQQMKQNGFAEGDFKIESLIAGFRDAFAEEPAKLSPDELRATQLKIQELLVNRLKEKGEKFLAANAKEDGVKTIEGGVQYKVLKAGNGTSPGPTDRVKVHYTGKLIDGTVFDSSVERGTPATFGVNQVIQGWQMALQKMKVGSKWMLYIPSELAYGERGSAPRIGPYEVLVFEVELLEIQ